MSDTLELARGWLQRCLELHQEAIVRQGYSEVTSARHAGEAAVLLGFQGLAQSFSEISGMDLPGVIIPDEHMWKALTTVRAGEELEVRFPLIDDAYLADCIQSYPDDDFDAAFRNARTEYDRECVLLTRAIRGQIAEALKACEDFTESSRRANVRFVSIAELFRRSDTDQGQQLLQQWPELLETASLPELALVANGRAGWGGYPYPDW